MLAFFLRMKGNMYTPSPPRKPTQKEEEGVVNELNELDDALAAFSFSDSPLTFDTSNSNNNSKQQQLQGKQFVSESGFCNERDSLPSAVAYLNHFFSNVVFLQDFKSLELNRFNDTATQMQLMNVFFYLIENHEKDKAMIEGMEINLKKCKSERQHFYEQNEHLKKFEIPKLEQSLKTIGNSKFSDQKKHDDLSKSWKLEKRYLEHEMNVLKTQNQKFNLQLKNYKSEAENTKNHLRKMLSCPGTDLVQRKKIYEEIKVSYIREVERYQLENKNIRKFLSKFLYQNFTQVENSFNPKLLAEIESEIPFDILIPEIEFSVENAGIGAAEEEVETVYEGLEGIGKEVEELGKKIEGARSMMKDNSTKLNLTAQNNTLSSSFNNKKMGQGGESSVREEKDKTIEEDSRVEVLKQRVNELEREKAEYELKMKEFEKEKKELERMKEEMKRMKTQVDASLSAAAVKENNHKKYHISLGKQTPTATDTTPTNKQPKTTPVEGKEQQQMKTRRDTVASAYSARTATRKHKAGGGGDVLRELSFERMSPIKTNK